MPRERPVTTDYVTEQATRWGVAAEIAAAQYGVVALRQLVQRGVRPDTARSWVQAKRLIPLHRGVYAVGHDWLRPEARYLAAVLACGDDSALSHGSAADHLEIRHSSSPVIDVTTPCRAGRSRRGLRIHCGRHLASDEVTVEQGVPCTTVARTLLDLAAGVLRTARTLSAAVETAERRGVLDLRDVNVCLARHRGGRGTARLREVLAAFDPEALRARSETEARFYFLCVDHGLAKPLVNRTIAVERTSLEVDFHWPASGLVVEVDSPYHDTTAARMRDRERDAALAAHGWTVIRCRWEEITNGAAGLAARVRGHLAVS